MLWERLVEEVEVDRIEPELSGTDLEAVKCSVVAVVADPERSGRRGKLDAAR
jgi:hypothetical protein